MIFLPTGGWELAGAHFVNAARPSKGPAGPVASGLQSKRTIYKGLGLCPRGLRRNVQRAHLFYPVITLEADMARIETCAMSAMAWGEQSIEFVGPRQPRSFKRRVELILLRD